MNTKGILSRLSRTAACIALAAGAQQALAQDIKIGFNGDLSASPSAQSGQAAVLGLKTAIEDIIAAGGLLGRKVVLVVRDDLSQPPKSIQNMTDLIDNEKSWPCSARPIRATRWPGSTFPTRRRCR